MTDFLFLFFMILVLILVLVNYNNPAHGALKDASICCLDRQLNRFRSRASGKRDRTKKIKKAEDRKRMSEK